MAAPLDTGLNQAGTAAGLVTADLPTLVGRIIGAFLGLLGVVAVVLILYAGFVWMTAQGNEDKIKTAKKTLTSAVIGLIIIMASWAIVAFVLNALGAGTGGGVFGLGSQESRFDTLFTSGRAQDALGNGVIDYHYPESAQSDVPRNTKVSITFKRPLRLSTVLANYDDNGTFTVSDDRLCNGAPPCPSGTPVSSLTNPTFALNTANVRLIANDGIEPSGSGTVDQQFDRHYPLAASVANPAPSARVTAVRDPFDPSQYQTLVFKPGSPIGSPTGAVNYRVALRGGANGVQIWQLPAGSSTPEAAAAFPQAFADGGYYWPFATGTTIDTTAPQVTSVQPFTTLVPGTPASSVLDRNQLLQIYFNEPMDPTTASGVIGTGGGFANIQVKAQCIPGTFPSSCTFNNGALGVVDGTLELGNRYRTAEFTPSTPCDGVSTNSCGEQVFCLPKNVVLEVHAYAATVGADAPMSSVDNGVTDMVGNSLDGNGNGKGEGPQAPVQPNGRTQEFYRNDPQTGAALDSVSDSTRWQYHVGSNVDLTVPRITKLDPPAAPPENLAHPDGPSSVPPNLQPSITWSKVMSIGSLRSGGFNEVTGAYTDSFSTVVLRSKECARTGSGSCPVPPTQCACQSIDPPGFFIDAGVPFEDPAGSGNFATKVSLVHPVRPFYTANDLGYTDQDIANYPDQIPLYAPIARAQIRDSKQNCFWPSTYRPNVGSPDCTLAPGQTSCCERVGTADGTFIENCAP